MFKFFLFAPLIILAFWFIVLPVVRYVATLTPPARNPVKEAQDKLRIAKDELAAARLNKEAEQLYEQLYQEALQDYDSEVEKENKS